MGPITTFTNIGGDNLATTPSVLETDHQVNPLVSASDWRTDVDQIVTGWTVVGGDLARFTMQAKCAVGSLVAPFKTRRLVSQLSRCKWW